MNHPFYVFVLLVKAHPFVVNGPFHRGPIFHEAAASEQNEIVRLKICIR